MNATEIYVKPGMNSMTVYTLPALKDFAFTAVWHHTLPTSELSLIPCASTVGTQTQTHVKPTSALHSVLFWEEKLSGKKPLSFCSVCFVASCA